MQRDGKTFKMCRIYIYSKQIVSDLKQKGIHECKSKILDWNEITSHIPQRLMRHFVRGFADGDGCWTHKNWVYKGVIRKRYPVFAVTCGSKKFIVPLATWISKQLHQPIKCALHKPTKAWIFNITGKKKCPPFFKIMYNNATIFLERKKKKAYNLLKVYS